MAIDQLINNTLTAIEAKDIAAVLEHFADNAVVIDPHYPTPHMVGKAAIGQGLQWAFSNLEQMHFSILNIFVRADGQSAAVEIATDHVVRGSQRLQFNQTFIIDTQAGYITRFQAYTPYGPGGIGGIMLGLLRLQAKMKRR